jgi:hypothetical protein
MKTDDLLREAAPRPWHAGGKRSVIIYDANGHPIADTQTYHEHHSLDPDGHSELITRDGEMQFGRLTGENLEAYSKTWAALAREAMALAEGEVQS